MMKDVKGFLIDPTTKTISEVTLNGDYKVIYGFIDASIFECVGIDETNSIFVDEEGLLKDEPGPFFTIPGRDPIAGKGLVLGCDDEGETVSATITREALEAMVSYPSVAFNGFKPIPDGTTVDHPILGRVSVVGHTPMFSEKEEGE